MSFRLLPCSFLLIFLATGAHAFPVSGTWEAVPGGVVGENPIEGPATLTVDEVAGTAVFVTPTFVAVSLDIGPPITIIETPATFTGTFTDPSTLELDAICVTLSGPFEPARSVVGDWTLSFSDPRNFEWSGTTTYYGDFDCLSGSSTSITSGAFMSNPLSVPLAGGIGSVVLAAALFTIGRRAAAQRD